MAGSGTKYSKMTALINYRLRVTLQDGRVLVGQLIAFDKFMNLVLSDCEEFRKTKRSNSISAAKKKAMAQGMTPPIAALAANLEERRTLGLLVLRGENVVSIVVESGPPPQESSTINFQKTPGVSLMPGASGPVPGLAGAVRGVVGGAMPAAARPPPMPTIPGIPASMMRMPPPPPMMMPGMVPPPHGMIPPPPMPPNMIPGMAPPSHLPPSMIPPPPPPPQFHQ